MLFYTIYSLCVDMKIEVFSKAFEHVGDVITQRQSKMASMSLHKNVQETCMHTTLYWMQEVNPVVHII